jgi:regulator of protease activity HflC (stomatin/prohibitin superfamily)
MTKFYRLLPLVLLGLTLGGCATVDTGYRGVVLSWGKPTGEIKTEGISFLMPFSGYDVKPMNVQTVADEIKTNAASRDLQTVNTTVTVNYHLDPSKVETVYDRLRTDYETRVINPTVHEAVKASTARFIANDLIAHRNEVRDAIDSNLRGQLSPYGIVVDQVLITDFSFDPGFQQAVEAKVAAQQTQLTAKIQSQTKYQQALIDNQTTIANAKADAEANRLKQQTLTPMLLQQQAIKVWDGHLPQVTSGGTPFIQLGSKD